MTLRAYTKSISKEAFVAETKKHQAADNFLKGTYDKGEKGCAVGCALKTVAKLKRIDLDFGDHAQFENHLGIPEWLAQLEESIFEGVTLERSKLWPVEFAEAINEGSDLEKIKIPFIVYLMEENLKSIRSVKYDADKFPDVKSTIDQTEKAILQMIEAQKSGDPDLISAAWSAAESAESAAWSAVCSVRSAARSAARSAVRSAWSTVWSVRSAESAESAARLAACSATWSAARSAAWSAGSAAESAWAMAEVAMYERCADKLLELMRDCKN